MLYIAESVPLPESTPPMPRPRSSFNISDLIQTDGVPTIPGIPGIYFRRNYSECRNPKEFPAIPSNSVSTEFSDLHTGITYLSHRVIFNYNRTPEGEAEK
jgi:hypothetical protein